MAQRLRWSLLFLALAALVLVGVASGIVLRARFGDIYEASVGTTRRWSEREERLAEIAVVAVAVEETARARVDAEEATTRLYRISNLRAMLDDTLSDLETDLQAEPGRGGDGRLIDDLGGLRRTVERTCDEAEIALGCSDWNGGRELEGLRNALARSAGEVRARIEGLRREAREIQCANLVDQVDTVESLHRLERRLAALALVAVLGLCLYGVRMARRAMRLSRARARAEEGLRQSEESLRTITETVPEIVWTARSDGAVDFFNRRWFEYTGLSPEVSEGWGWSRAVHEDDQERCRANWIDSVREGRDHEVEFRLRRADDGAWRWHLGRAVAQRDAQGRIARWFGTCTDIDDAKRAQEALRESEERFDLAVKGSSDGIWDWNLSNDEMVLSARWKELLGYAERELPGRFETWESHLHPADAGRVLDALRAHLHERAAFDVECRMRTRSGDYRWYRWRGQAVWAPDGRATRMAGSLTDITPQKEALAAILRLEGIEEAKLRIEAQAVELEQKTRELEEAREAAVAASRAKSEFLANMSHEIRTPMTAILGYADMLADAGPSPIERMEGVQRIRKSGQHLLAILNDILDLSKIEAGRMTVERIECDVPQIVAEVLSLMRPRAIEKSLDLRVEYAAAIPRAIHSDPTRLRQILMNLVGNSIKFTKHGEVRLGVGMAEAPASGGPRIRFSVADTGIGMTPEQVALLFRPFTQADGSMARKFGGTGLGLTISRRLAEMLGGDITASAEAGRGATFTVEVQTGPLDGIPWIRPDHEAELTREGADTHRSRPARAHALAHLGGARILLADDARDNQKIISYHLRRAGAEVLFADDGRAAVLAAQRALADERPFVVVLMDMQMPELDGYGATRLLRSSGYRLPIVALTAHAMSGDRDLCIAAGCDDYATKPIDPERLLATVARWVAAGASADHVAGPIPDPRAGTEPCASIEPGEARDVPPESGPLRCS